MLQQKTPGPLDNPGEARVLVVAERDLPMNPEMGAQREIELNWKEI